MNGTTLFIIRHGQTDWNVAGRLQGQIDIPLNAKGIEQAQKVAQCLKKRRVFLAGLYSSDLQRAHQTALEISQVFALDILPSADLREGNFGKAQGLTKKEISDLFGSINHQALPETLEAEPRNKVVARIMKRLTVIAQKHRGQQVAVVTHGAALESVICHLGYDVQDLPIITNESITTFIWHAEQSSFSLESIEHVD